MPLLFKEKDALFLYTGACWHITAHFAFTVMAEAGEQRGLVPDLSSQGHLQGNVSQPSEQLTSNEWKVLRLF